jgi:uncharacterized Zn-finger protein
MSEENIIYVETTTVACEGNGDAIGHPLVYLDLSKEKEVVCPYCSQHFILKG